MINIWNKRNLKPPIMASYTTRLSKFKYSNDIGDTVDFIHKYYKHQTKFYEALLINQQMLYLRYIQFRSDIGFQKLQKINSAYKRLVSINITSLLEKILKSISIEKYNDSIQLPTKETFEYLLVKLMGLFKIVLRIVELSKEAAECFVKLTNLSFFVELSTMLLATLSDIYCIGSDIARKTINHYNNLIEYHSALKSSKKKWDLSADFRFPSNLIDCASKDDSEMIKYECPPNTNPIGMQPGNINLPKMNKLFQQTDIEIGCEISRNDMDICTNVKLKKHKSPKIKQ